MWRLAGQRERSLSTSSDADRRTWALLLRRCLASEFSNELRTAKRSVHMNLRAAVMLIGLGGNESSADHTRSSNQPISGMLREYPYFNFGRAGFSALWIMLALTAL